MARSLDDHIQIDLEMKTTIIDLSLYCKLQEDELVGLNGKYVYDLLRAGTNAWQTQSDATLERFKTTGNEQPSFIFAGMHIAENKGMFHIDQNFYKSRIEQLRTMQNSASSLQ